MSQGNISRHKTTENGIKAKPPYSVETPYGFQIDLDFLKYVDDIEKGNTIKRVPILRRSKGSRASTLPRHLNPSGYGCRPSPWGSTGALGPRSRLSDTHPHGYTSWAHDYRRPLSPTRLKSMAEMEARIREFDEQPLGEHIRPHLLRASSMPLTVLLRQESESTDERSSLQSSRDQLGGRNTSCEDVFSSPDSPRPQDCSGLLRRLTEALERVGELEMEVRVVPELRAQICILQEERERLRLGLVLIPPSTINGATEPSSSSDYSKMEMKRPQHEHHIRFPRNYSIIQDDSNPTHEWKTSTDLDELLTVTALQAKVAMLEQKLHETSLELHGAVGLLKEQQEESRRKDEKMDHLIKNPGVWVRAERVMVEQNGDETVVRSIEPDYNKSSSFICTRTVTTNAGRNQQDSVTLTESSRLVEAADASADSTDTAAVVHHIKRIKSLLDQQWEWVCGGTKSGDKGKILKHPDPKVNSLQQEMMELVDVLMSHYNQHGHGDGEKKQQGASKSTLKTDRCAQTSKNQHSEVADDGLRMSARGNMVSLDCRNQSNHGDLERREIRTSPGRMDAALVDVEPVRRGVDEDWPAGPNRHVIPVGTGSGRTGGGAASLEAPEKTAKSKPPGEQMGGKSGSETSSREMVSADFMSACHFLSDHMDNMDNPDDDMRKALVTLFQHWFGAAAEEASEDCRVAAYLKEVKKATPSLLAFLVNLADDNGNTVLHYSVSHCNYSIVGLLLDTGVSDVNAQNNTGYTAVMLASLTAPDGPGGMEVVRKLMELGNVNIRSSQTGQTALHLAVRHGRVVMVRLLLSCGADANIQDNQGTTALMFASERGHTHIARLLLERSQCDLKLMDKRGQTALSVAMRGSHTDTAALLQAHAKARAL
ncbi:KN motif and ankyrin repeat domain-containing protein 4-like [Melanotaenia boesemani]|uniref:KN motif and ankyrin repeat domain-containing protein 4-like n=1 Tax=Melanotaenia boesemani TaxID=1250792 RepID=UPI001C03AAAD|nr:KN motif and ankyrin repeat domain-containing protein 4-like [Melanotaenia boesemani]